MVCVSYSHNIKSEWFSVVTDPFNFFNASYRAAILSEADFSLKSDSFQLRALLSTLGLSLQISSAINKAGTIKIMSKMYFIRIEP